MGLLKNFTLKELWCPCPQCITDTLTWDKFDVQFLAKLEQLRKLAGAPLVVNSSYRCAAHHAKIYSTRENVSITSKSGHLYIPERGVCAADICCGAHIPAALAELAARVGFSGIGLAGRYVHVDTIDRTAWWQYKPDGTTVPLFNGV